MTDNLCRWCRPESEDDRRKVVLDTNLTGSTVQQDKYDKHANGRPASGLNGVFDDGSYDNYQSQMEHANVSGSSVQGAVLHTPPTSPGRLEKFGTPIGSATTTKLVCMEDPTSMHAFPFGPPPQGAVCSQCGKPIDFSGKT